MVFLLVVLCLVATACSPAPVERPEAVVELETLIPRLMAAAEVPGLQIAVIRDGEIVVERGFGVAAVPDGAPVDADTVFEAASLTKPLFAYTVMTLVDDGVLDLDRPLVELLPEGAVEAALGHPVDAEGFRADWLRMITPRHVLSHSAGTAHGEGGAVYPLAFQPGTDWKYSADGYAFLQLAVEHLTGRPLDVLVDETVLQPLGMNRSAMVWRDSLEPHMARGHGLYGEVSEIRKRTEAHAAASLYTTAGDYARFVLAVIDGAGLEPATHAEMLGWAVDMSDDGRLGWSLGFGLQRDGDASAFWQWGDYGIFRNYVIASAADRSGVVYLTNSFNGLALCEELVEASFGRPPLGCRELEYQQHDSGFYALFRAARDGGAEAVRALLPAAVDEAPEFLDADRLAAMAGLLEEEGMYGEAEVFHAFNLERRPGSGEAILAMARLRLLQGELDEADKLLRASLTAEQPAAAAEAEWIQGYLRAVRQPESLDGAALAALEGDYGPRHLRLRDGRLLYGRDLTDVDAMRPLIAASSDTFVLEGVIDFKLRVEVDGNGRPVALVGLYQGGRSDRTPRDP
ncbi:MAG TPA: serine hydrolase domain-containing protein [Candidatus Sulfomarinibacteraceae bacterium]|nr:serine hydrolase domain-containing protein [Candidatus Sulfomarinibacteraceae bacterium]